MAAVPRAIEGLGSFFNILSSDASLLEKRRTAHSAVTAGYAAAGKRTGDFGERNRLLVWDRATQVFERDAFTGRDSRMQPPGRAGQQAAVQAAGLLSRLRLVGVCQ